MGDSHQLTKGPTTMNKSFPAIYDFSVLPYALGDVITWSIKTAIRASRAKYPTVNLFVCTDKNEPACSFQSSYVNSKNYRFFFKDLDSIFQFHPLANKYRVFNDRSTFEEAIYAFHAKEENPVIQANFLQYLKAYKSRFCPQSLRKYHESEISFHSDINEHYLQNLEIPRLKCLDSIREHVKTSKRNLGDRVFIALNFRLRGHDKNTDDAWLNRDSDIETWLKFLSYCSSQHPNVCFVLLGKLEEKPLELLALENCFVPRLNNQSLAHELAWIEESDFFMGSSSGFAAMANFSKTPYVITKVTKIATDAYCIPFGTQKLPFAKGFQELIYEPESKELLIRLLKTFLQHSSNLKKSKVMPREKIIKASSGQVPNLDQESKPTTSLSEISSLLENGQFQKARQRLDITLLRSLTSDKDKSLFHYYSSRVLYEFREYPQAKAESSKVTKEFNLDEHQTLVEQINASLLLENIDRFLALNPDADSSFLGIEKVRAKCFLVVEDFIEASRSLERHAECFPEDSETKKIEKSLGRHFKNALEKRTN
ncbi:MAG: hypothetical protein VX130_07225 [Verrucomicrobiota bacterium]|nr:hypothetical protein [Verrucomicrobiota bacterium]